MGLFDKLFKAATDSPPPNPGANLYYSLVQDCVTETFKIADKKQGSEIEAILFFSELVRYTLIANFYKSNQKVLVESFDKDFNNAVVKDLVAKDIENYVTNPTGFINNRSKFYWSQWAKYSKAIESYYKTERTENTFTAFTKYIHQNYQYEHALDLIYNIPFQQFDEVPPIVITDPVKYISTGIRFVQLIASAWDATQNRLMILHSEGIF